MHYFLKCRATYWISNVTCPILATIRSITSATEYSTTASAWGDRIIRVASLTTVPDRRRAPRKRPVDLLPSLEYVLNAPRGPRSARRSSSCKTHRRYQGGITSRYPRGPVQPTTDLRRLFAPEPASKQAPLTKTQETPQPRRPIRAVTPLAFLRP